MQQTNPQQPGEPLPQGQPPQRITHADLLSNNQALLNQIATLFDNPNHATLLLDALGYNRAMRPPFTEPIHFWNEVCRQIGNGITTGGLEALLIRVSESFPGNALFRNTLSRYNIETRADARKGINLHIDGWDAATLTQDDLMARVNTAAAALGITGGIEFSYCTGNRLSVFLHEHTDRAAALLDRLQTTEMPDLVINMSSPGSQRDYLLSRIYVEGPDMGRFQFSNIPASTPVRDIGNSIANEYGATWPGASGNTPRATVVDHLTPQGTTERVKKPDSTLHDNHIQDGDTMQVNTESTVASYINPIIRDQALVRVRIEIEEFGEENPAIKIERNNPTLPTQYWIKFTANGRAIPQRKNLLPMPQTEHLVCIWLEPGFPVSAPFVYWEKPVIFHPNVNAETGYVCLGELKDRYRPGLDMANLCRTIIDVANYRNYEANSCLNDEAGAWAKSEQGQAEIVKYGGKAIPINDDEENRQKKWSPQLQIKKI